MSPDTVKWFSDNWAALTEAPWLFVTLAVIVAAVVYAISTWFKNEQIAVLDRRIAEYENKLKVGSPDEAKTMIDRLEGEISGMNKEQQHPPATANTPAKAIIGSSIVLRPARASTLISPDRFYSRAEKERIVDTMNVIQRGFTAGRKMMWEAEKVASNPGHNDELDKSIERIRAVYTEAEQLNIDFDKIRDESHSYPVDFAVLLAAKPVYSDEFQRAVYDYSNALYVYRHVFPLLLDS